MVTQVYSDRKQATTAVARVSPLAEVVETIREDALALAREKTATFHHTDVPSLLNRPKFMDTFRYGMAVNVAQVLAEYDQNVRAVYSYDPGLNADAESGDQLPVDPTVHLLVVVATPSAALEAFIKSLERALIASLKGLNSPMFARREFILDVNVITEKDVELRRGYGSLLAALFTPPLKIWQR